MHGTMKRAPKPSWRLRKTLSRNVSFRPIERDDMRYAWAAYKKGALASMGEKWAAGEMDAATFSQAFEVEVSTVYHGAWTLIATTAKGHMPAGIVLGFWSHPDPRFAPFMIVGDILWFPWASGRNKIESAVNFFNRIRSEIAMVEYASEQHRRFFDVMCQHGIMRRAGTLEYAIGGQKMAIFETVARAS